LALRKKHFPTWSPCPPENFCFLYTQKRQNTPPLIVKLTSRFISANAETLHYNNLLLPGMGKLLDDTDWYLKNQCFDRHRMIAENNGVVNIDILMQ
jgi:hypothetical protein